MQTSIYLFCSQETHENLLPLSLHASDRRLQNRHINNKGEMGKDNA